MPSSELLAITIALCSCIASYCVLTWYAGTFKMSRYLCTKGEIPIADYILLESVQYSGHYIRRYDDNTVDCEVCAS